MDLIIPVLAEVGDKIPRLPMLSLWCVGLSVLAWSLGKKQKWFGVSCLPFACLYALGVTAEPRDTFVGPAIIHELGYYYPITCYFLAIIPFVVIAAAFFRAKISP